MIDLKTAVEKINSKIEKLLRSKDIVVIGIGGGSASGKTYLAKMLEAKILSMDSYYLGKAMLKEYNFDTPDALDLELLKQHLEELRQHKSIKKPVYDFKKEARNGYEIFTPAPVIIVEGLFTLLPSFLENLSIKIFVDSYEGNRLERRVVRDMNERGRTRNEVLKQWYETVEPMCQKYVLPTMKNADIVVKN